MKINYDLSSKELVSQMNIAIGIYQKRKSLKRSKKKKIKTFTQILFQKYTMCLIGIMLMVLISTFKNSDNLSMIIFSITILLFLKNTISLIKSIIKYRSQKKRYQKGTIRFNKDGLVDIYEEEKMISRSWDEIELIVMTDKLILIFDKVNSFFMIPNDTKKEAKVKQVLEKYKINDKLIIKELPQKWQNIIWNYTTYIMIFLIITGLYIFWDYINVCLIDQEIYNINNTEEQIDFQIKSYEKYGIVEKDLKEYFKKFKEARKSYEENKAETIYSFLTIDVLKKRDELEKIKNSLEEKEQIASQGIEIIMELLEEETAMKEIKEQNLGEYFEDTFKKYALTEYDDFYKEGWIEELAKNKSQMTYVKRALEILIEEPECWYIENEKFYMNDKNIEEYNKIHDIILGSNSNKV